MTAVKFEQQVRSILARTGMRLESDVLLDYKRVDLVAEKQYFNTTRRIAVECKDYSKNLSRQAVAEIYSDLVPLIESRRVDEVFLVTRVGLTATAKAFIARVKHIVHVSIGELEALMEVPCPPEILPFAKLFTEIHPAPEKTAFVMMRFTHTRLHQEIFEAVRSGCSKHGITAVRADDRAYADDLLANSRTYMHGCGFGIAIFERLTADEFNPNVSLEVGYLMALGKPVLLLKDSTLSELQADLVARLYEPFDCQQPDSSIPPIIEKWLVGKSLI